MNGLGKTANRTSSYIKPGAKSKSIFEALLKANGSSIYEMLREPQGGRSIYEEMRYAKHIQNSGRGKKASILDVDWKKRA